MAEKAGGSGRRALQVRVKTAKRRKASSTRWLERQLNDPYVARAHDEGYRARSAYKLIEIDDRFHLLGAGQAGRRSRRRARRLVAGGGGASRARPTPIRWSSPSTISTWTPIPGVVVPQADFLDDDAPDALRAALGGHPADVVLSDMAAPTTGHRQTDHLRTMHLCESRGRFRRDRAEARRPFRRQGLPRRHRGRAARPAEARLHQPASRQAAGEPLRVGRALSGRPRLSRQPRSIQPAWLSGRRRTCPDISCRRRGASSQNEIDREQRGDADGHEGRPEHVRRDRAAMRRGRQSAARSPRW